MLEGKLDRGKSTSTATAFQLESINQLEIQKKTAGKIYSVLTIFQPSGLVSPGVSNRLKPGNVLLPHGSIGATRCANTYVNNKNETWSSDDQV